MEGARQQKWKTEPLLGIAALTLLLVGCVFVLRPFFSALMWAIVLAYTLHPLQRVFTRWFRGSRTLAACCVTLTVLTLVAGPIALIGISLAEDGKELATATRDWFLEAPEEAPSWLAQLPVVGDELAGYWATFADQRDRWMEQVGEVVKKKSADAEAAAAALPAGAAPAIPAAATAETAVLLDDSPQLVNLLGRFLAWARTGLVAAGRVFGQGVMQVLASAFLAFFLLRDAPVLSERLAVAVDRLAGSRGQHLLKVAGDTVRGVIFGILGTAIAQAVVAWLGFWIAGVPGSVLLAMLTLVVAVVPFGPPLVWIPAALWLFAQGSPGWGVFMLLWGALGISSVDNILRPFLISQGSNMPFALIFFGVIGGVLAFGVVGIFLGPTLLAVAFRLIDEWSATLPPRVGAGYRIEL